jgi:hypothetical protein
MSGLAIQYRAVKRHGQTPFHSGWSGGASRAWCDPSRRPSSVVGPCVPMVALRPSAAMQRQRTIEVLACVASTFMASLSSRAYG